MQIALQAAAARPEGLGDDALHLKQQESACEDRDALANFAIPAAGFSARVARFLRRRLACGKSFEDDVAGGSVSIQRDAVE